MVDTDLRTQPTIPLIFIVSLIALLVHYKIDHFLYIHNALSTGAALHYRKSNCYNLAGMQKVILLNSKPFQFTNLNQQAFHPPEVQVAVILICVRFGTNVLRSAEEPPQCLQATTPSPRKQMIRRRYLRRPRRRTRRPRHHKRMAMCQ